MNKKIISIIMAAGIAAILFAPIACSNEWARFNADVLESGEARLCVRDGVGYLRWASEAGAVSYNLYSGESRYGEYDLVCSLSANDTRYKVTDDLYSYYMVEAVYDGGATKKLTPASAFGNTTIISQDDDMTAVQGYIDEMHDLLENGRTGQFRDDRVALAFLPGNYPDICAKLGYYTSALGLGEVPSDVTVGDIFVSHEVLSNDNATHTFWRSAENFTVNKDVEFAVSQATSLRRMNIGGNLALSHASGWSSGGYMANSKVTGTVDPGTQQQWMSRNDEWGSWKNTMGGHNYVFAGCEGNTPQSAWSDSTGRITSVEVAKMAEKPFLYRNGNSYAVFVPEVTENSSGVTWSVSLDDEIGYSIGIDRFYIAQPQVDNADTINAALASGKHLLLTPGIYKLEKPLCVTKANTVVLGLGYATLVVADGNRDTALRISDIDGVRISDVLIDAGAKSNSLMEVGQSVSTTSHAENPTVLSNIYMRIGGKENVHTEVDTALIINSNDVIGDHFWLWRADHYNGVAWNDYADGDNIVYGNPARCGLAVYGNNVSCYALMVEHFEGYQTYWQGEGGLTVMYQCETPYRIFSQEDWTSPDGKLGCAGYKVADGVNAHRAYGVGVYLVNYSNCTLESAIEAPKATGVVLEHLVTCSFAHGDGSVINNVINDIGGAVGYNESSRRLVESFGK